MEDNLLEEIKNMHGSSRDRKESIPLDVFNEVMKEICI